MGSAPACAIAQMVGTAVLGAVITRSSGRTPQARRGEMEGVCARSHAHRVMGAAVARKFALEGLDPAAQDVEAAREGARHRRAHLAPDLPVLARQVEKGNVHAGYQ